MKINQFDHDDAMNALSRAVNPPPASAAILDRVAGAWATGASTVDVDRATFDAALRVVQAAASPLRYAGSDGRPPPHGVLGPQAAWTLVDGAGRVAASFGAPDIDNLCIAGPAGLPGRKFMTREDARAAVIAAA